MTSTINCTLFSGLTAAVLWLGQEKRDLATPPSQEDFQPRSAKREGKRTPAPQRKVLPDFPLPDSLPSPTVDSNGVKTRPLVVPNCRVRYASEVQVPATIPGRLVEVLVREGDEVKAGDVLARIDDEEARLETELKGIAATNDAAVEAAKARIGWYKQQFETTAKLLRSGGSSVEELEGRRQQWIAAQHELRNEQNKRDQADADHEKSQSQLNRHTIESPIPGVVRERRRHAFEAVQAMETVFHIVRTDRMKIEGEFDQRQIGRIARGTPVEVWPERIVGEIDRVTHPTSIWCVRFLADGKRLAFSTADGALVVWNFADQRRERVIAASGKPIRAFALSSTDPSLAIAGDDDGTIKFWNLDTGKESKESFRPLGEFVPVTALECRQGDLAYVGFANGVVQRWNCKTGILDEAFTTPGRRAAHVNQVTSLSLSADGRRLLSVSDDHSAAVWSVDGNAAPLIVTGREGPPDKEVRQCSFSPDGAEFPFSVLGLLQTRRAEDGLPTLEIERVGERDPFVWLSVFTPKQWLMVTARETGDLELWRIAPGRQPRLARVFAGHDKERTIRRVDFTEGGSLMATCGDDRTVRIWRLPTVEELDRERLPGAIVFVSPQVEAGTNAVKFHAEVLNRGGILTANARAAVLVHPRGEGDRR